MVRKVRKDHLALLASLAKGAHLYMESAAHWTLYAAISLLATQAARTAVLEVKVVRATLATPVHRAAVQVRW